MNNFKELMKSQNYKQKYLSYKVIQINCNCKFNNNHKKMMIPIQMYIEDHLIHYKDLNKLKILKILLNNFQMKQSNII